MNALDWYLKLQQESRIDDDILDNLLHIDAKISNIMQDGSISERKAIEMVYNEVGANEDI